MRRGKAAVGVRSRRKVVAGFGGRQRVIAAMRHVEELVVAVGVAGSGGIGPAAERHRYAREGRAVVGNPAAEGIGVERGREIAVRVIRAQIGVFAVNGIEGIARPGGREQIRAAGTQAADLVMPGRVGGRRGMGAARDRDRNAGESHAADGDMAAEAPGVESPAKILVGLIGLQIGEFEAGRREGIARFGGRERIIPAMRQPADDVGAVAVREHLGGSVAADRDARHGKARAAGRGDAPRNAIDILRHREILIGLMPGERRIGTAGGRESVARLAGRDGVIGPVGQVGETVLAVHVGGSGG